MINSCQWLGKFCVGYIFCKLQPMAKFVFFTCLVILCTQKTSGQKSPAEFGATAFYCFQHNKMDSLFKMIPSLSEITLLAKELGIVQGTEAYTAFIKKYPLVIKS